MSKQNHENSGLVSNHWQLSMLLALFVLSGFAGLIYQSIWSHYLGLFLGHAAYAQALVLAIFMGGMAAGAGMVARAGLRWRNLVRGYAWVELLIGGLGLVFHWLFVGVLGLSYELIIPALGSSWLVESYKWLLAALLILPQTILLGMTFPLMSGGIIRRYPGRDGHVLGGLYFANSIGAALGVLVAVFVLLPRVGLPGTVMAAAWLNLGVGLLAWWLSRGVEPRPVVEGPHRQPLSASQKKLLWLVLAATFFSGAASFVYEIVWVRMLSLAVGNTLHAFELMLASFIAGIAFGGLWVRKRADHSPDVMRLLGWLQLWMGLAALVSLLFYANAFAWVGFLMQVLTPTDGGYHLFNLATGLIAILIMMPAAFFAGTTLPLFTVALLRNGQGEASIGRVYAWNTLGAIAGVLLAIHFLIPYTDLRLALVLAAIVDMTIGVLLLRRQSDSRRKLVVTGLAASGAVACALLIMLQVPYDPMRLSSGVYRSGQAVLPQGDEIVYYRDGKTASISVVTNDGGTVRIATNGKVDASVQMIEAFEPSADEATMVLAAAIPLAYLEQPRSAAVIGFGSGLTSHALLAEPAFARVDTIEIEAAMMEGATWFGSRVARAYQDPRSNIIIDDAKSYFAGTQHRYDIIVSEPSNPWISGVGALFSKEFYQFVPRFLSDDGVCVQWLQLYEINEQLVGSVLAALTPAFSDYHAYLVNQADLLIVAANRPLAEPDLDALFQADIAADLADAGIDNADQIRLRKVADHHLLDVLGERYPHRVNSDYFPVLSLQAPRSRFRRQSARGIIGLPALQVPLLEVLGINTPLPPGAFQGVERHFQPAMQNARARALAKVLGGEEALDDSAESLNRASFAHQLSTLSDACQQWQAHQQQMLVKLIYELAGRTLAPLHPHEQRGVLIEPQWQNCQQPPPAMAELLALLEAMAGRDYPALREQVPAWLAGSAERPDYYSAFDPLALFWLQAAHIQQGRFADARASLERWSPVVPLQGDYLQATQLMQGWLERQLSALELNPQ